MRGSLHTLSASSLLPWELLLQRLALSRPGRLYRRSCYRVVELFNGFRISKPVNTIYILFARCQPQYIVYEVVEKEVRSVRELWISYGLLSPFSQKIIGLHGWVNITLRDLLEREKWGV